MSWSADAAVGKSLLAKMANAAKASTIAEKPAAKGALRENQKIRMAEPIAATPTRMSRLRSSSAGRFKMDGDLTTVDKAF